MLQLRNYQQQVIDDLEIKLETNRRVVLTAGTGAGKTEMACAIAKTEAAMGRKVWFVVHRDNLVRQTQARFAKYGLETGIIAAGASPRLQCPVQVATFQSLARRKAALDSLNHGQHTIFWDEAHVTAFTTLGRALIGANPVNQRHIALTATPRRLKKFEGFSTLFDAQVIAPVPSELMEMGFLVPAEYYGLPKIDTRGVRTTGGDFNIGDLGIAVNKPEVIQDAVRNWFKFGQGRKTIGFTVDVAHAQALSKAFNDAGVKAAAVHGGMDPLREREPLYKALAKGDLTAIFSCEALAEGFDCPEVSCVILSRPTQSWAKYMQQLGRGLRICPWEGKEKCIILDQSGNVLKFGFVEDLTREDFEMDSPGDKGDGEAPTKVCPQCEHIVHASAKSCKHCGFVFPLKVKEMATGEMQALKAKDITFSKEAQFYRSERKKAYLRKLAPGYAFIKFNEKYNKDLAGQIIPPDRLPRVAQWSFGAVFGPEPSLKDKNDYYQYLRGIAERKDKDRGWIATEFDREFGKGAYLQTRFDPTGATPVATPVPIYRTVAPVQTPVVPGRFTGLSLF